MANLAASLFTAYHEKMRDYQTTKNQQMSLKKTQIQSIFNLYNK